MSPNIPNMDRSCQSDLNAQSMFCVLNVVYVNVFIFFNVWGILYPNKILNWREMIRSNRNLIKWSPAVIAHWIHDPSR